ncbi:MAG TPA: glutathione S-transferase [Kofleriaceae bacterium]
MGGLDSSHTHQDDTVTSSTIVIHGTVLSGHTHRVENFLSILGIPYRLAHAPPAVRQTPQFRALNPLGQIPVLEDGDLVIADSNAILVYLAKRYAAGTNWLPEAPVAAARVQRWLSIAAGELKFGPAAARVITVWKLPGDLATAQDIAARLLRFMDGHLADSAFLAAEHPTIADLACYSYIAHAPEGRISLAEYAWVRAWVARVEALPGFKPMPVSEIPEAG